MKSAWKPACLIYIRDNTFEKIEKYFAQLRVRLTIEGMQIIDMTLRDRSVCFFNPVNKFRVSANPPKFSLKHQNRLF